MKSPWEAFMAGTGTVRPSRSGHIPRLNLNSDGRPHPLLNAASFFTLIIGLLSFALGLFLRTDPSSLHGWAIVAAATGLAGLLVGLVSQMMSATREERIIIVTGIIAAFVGLALGLAHGGFS
jgi:FtsH-binding integral membrane protein